MNPLLLLAALLSLALMGAPAAAQKSRARDLGIPLDGQAGPLNAITDVAGVEVGHTTLVSGDGYLVVGKGPVRTGVTAVLPRGRRNGDPVFAAWFSLNGNGEMTGTTWVEESGLMAGPVMITNTHSVGTVRDAVIAWQLRQGKGEAWSLPVVAETFDGILNDINGFHVKPEHVFRALDSARGGAVQEGNVGGGTGMLCNGFKGGIGTSSRKLPVEAGSYTVGVLVQCNYGGLRGLRIAGIPVGRSVAYQPICAAGSRAPSLPYLRGLPRCSAASSSLERPGAEMGSIIIVVATDAPLLPHQLRRLARRPALGLGREGSFASNLSGDIFIAFSTANPRAGNADSATVTLRMVPNDKLDPLFVATVQATEEAVTNAMLAAETMVGADSVRAIALPHEWLRGELRKYGRLEK